MSMKRKAGLVQHLWGKEHGLPKKPRTLHPEAANLLAEEKATLPARNQSCEMSGQSRATFLVDFSPDHTKMASTHGDHSVRVTDIKSGKCLHVLKGHPRTPWTLAWHPTSNDILASGCLAGVVRIWDLRGGGCEVWQTTDGSVISSLTFHPTDQVLVIAADNYIHFWDWTQERPFTKCKTAHKEEKVRWVKFDRWGQYLYTGIVNSVTNTEDRNEEVGYINNNNRATTSDSMCNEDRQNLQSYYRDIVEQITNQRERINNNEPSTRSRVPRLSDTLQQINSVYPAVASVSQHSGETYSGPHQANISMVGPHSPVHLDILEDARQYASHLTQRVHNARQYAAHLTHSTWLGHDDAERQVIRIRNHQASNDARNARTESEDLHSIDELVSNDTASTLGDHSLLNSLPPASDVLGSLPSTSRTSSFGRAGFSSSSVRNVTSPLMVSVPSPSLPYPTSSITTSALMVSMLSISHASTMQGTSPTVTLTGASISNNITSVASGSTTVTTTACSVIPSTGSIHSSNPANPTPSNSQANLGLNSSLSTATSPSPSYTRLIQAARAELSSRSTSLQGAASSPQRHSKSNKRQRDSSNSPVRRSRSAKQSISHQSSRSSNLSNCSSSQSHSDGAQRGTTGVPTSSTASAAQSSGPSLLGSLLLRRQLRNATSDCPSSHSSSSNAAVSRSTVTPVTVIPSNLPASAAAASSSHRPSLLRCHLLAEQSNINVTREQVSLSGSSQATEQEEENADNRQIETDMNHNNIGQLGPRGVDTTASRGVEAVGSSGPLGNVESASSGGNEVRNVLERVRSRQIDIQHTLSAFCQLQGPAESSVSQELPTSPVTSSAPISQSFPELSSTAAPSSTGTSQSATLPSSVNSISEEVDRRLESLNQLGQRVSQITQRMSERARNLVQEGNRTLGEMRRHHRRSSHRQQPYPTSQQRQRRLQAILEMWRPCQRAAAAGAAEARPRDANSSPRAEETRGHAETDQEGVTHLHRRHRQLRVEIENMHSELTRRIHQQRREHPSWYTLQRRTLHPHYSVSILDDTINRNDGLQAAINRAIAGAFMGVGESAVASNIISETYRIQRWDFNNCQIPDISQAYSNVVVSPCKIHNDASCDISQDGRYLCTFVPSHRGFPDDTILGVFSLESSSLGQCFYTKSFGPNAISVSISPLNNYVLVGLAAKRLAWVFTQKQMVAQIFKLRRKFAGEDSVEHICDLMHPCELDIRSHITVNSARWLPGVGEGVVYGTNRGDLHICTPGDDERDSKEQRPPVDANQENNFDQSQRNLMQMLGLAGPQTMSAGTQTVHRIRRSASTQTESSHHVRDVD